MRSEFYKFDVQQWGIGHGGFHSQSLRFGATHPRTSTREESIVRVIYDCGSGRGARPRESLRSAVRRMVSTVADGATIDLLVISHFDQDHVNGLDFLAATLSAKSVRVSRVWAPVLTDIEALLAVTRSRLTGRNLQNYVSLIVDPDRRLAELFADAEITRFSPNDEPIPSAVEAANDVLPDRSDGNMTLRPAPGGRGLIASPPNGNTGEAFWEFQPYVVRSTLVGAFAITSQARRLLGRSLKDLSVSDVVKLGKDQNLMSTFHEEVRRHHRESKTAARQSSARTGPNISSLCVYSGPVSPDEWRPVIEGSPADPDAVFPASIAPAWLGTGDAGLRDWHHVEAMSSALGEARLNRVGICSAPHHGSRLDSGLPLWLALPNAQWITIEADRGVGGSGNRHPHSRVLDELAIKDLRVHIATSGMDFSWVSLRCR